MIKKLLLFFLAFISVGYAHSQDWNTSLIPDSLKKDADAVIRYSSQTIERLSLNEYSIQVHQVITVLNDDGASDAELMINYDDKSSVDFEKGSIYNKSGALIKSIKKKDLDDYAYSSSYTLFSDDRIKYYYPRSSSYPYTVEYIYTKKYSSVVGYPIWMPSIGYDVAVENAELSLITSGEFELIHKELNYDFTFQTEEGEKGSQKLIWQASNIKAISYETSTLDYLEIFPVVIITPTNISYDGYTGDFSTWENYGKWVYSLLEGRDILPESTISEINNLTQSLETEKEKVEVLYKYMQGKTRYVSVALGIGGFQPFSAEEVDEKGYGDCKALSNYMRTLLKYVGIESYYTEIGNGNSRKIKFEDFPSINQTNHVILCVPLPTDTVWLECTSQTMPFGYIGGSNSDRYCLLVTPEGGILMSTPTYCGEENVRSSFLSLSLSDEGSAYFKLETEYTDYFIEDVLYLFSSSPVEQKNSLLNSLEGNGLKVADFAMENESADDVKGGLYVEGSISDYASKTGTRLFLTPNFILSNDLKTKLKSNRKQSFYEPVGFVVKDTLSVSYPINMNVEFLPADAEIQSEYGKYRLEYRDEGGKIRITRSIEINKGIYNVSQFEEINQLLAFITGQEKAKIILKRTD